MNRTAQLPIILCGMLCTLITSGCEVPQADAGQPPPPAQAGNIAQKRQGLTMPIKRKVATFSYSHELAVHVGSGSGCQFLLDGYPTRLFRVAVDPTTSFGTAADGMCRMALDSLKAGSEVAVVTWGDDITPTDDVASVTITR